MEYETMISLNDETNFTDMNKKQADEYFEWYKKQINNRITILENVLKSDGYEIDLDFSVDSLLPLWSWYEQKITYQYLNTQEYNSVLKEYPDWMKNEINNMMLSRESISYGMDVAIYFAEVVIRNSNGKLNWGYFTKPKNRSSVNQPTILGFKYGKDLNPRLIVYNCACESANEKMPSRLLEIYKVWLSFV